MEGLGLIAAMRRHARQTPDRVALRFLRDGEEDERAWTCAELDHASRCVAAQVSRFGAGARLVLLYPQGLEQVAALTGCMRAGVLAAPLQAPGSHRARSALARVRAVVDDGGAQAVLTTAALAPALAEVLAADPVLAKLPILRTDAPGETVDPQPAERDVASGVAYLQYTSGSTASPKGVCVTHRSLATNLAEFDDGYGHDASSVTVSWLPGFHDLGLVYGIFLPLWRGFPAVLLDPLHFIQAPLRWLRAIARYRGTHAAAPNFAYALCVARSTEAERAAIDLSSWRVALNGAEPIRYDTEAAFVEAFRVSGVTWRTMNHAYGMSEATAKISAEPWDTDPVFLDLDGAALDGGVVQPCSGDAPGARRVAGCGRINGQTRVAIADPSTLEALPEGRVGEIWVHGPTVAAGYHGRPTETEATFGARTSGGDGPFMRTGDLGFLWRGDLFVTGRLKDLIIIRGENRYPQDVEAVVEASHGSLRPGASVAFATRLDATDALVVVAEVDPSAPLGAVVDACLGALTADGWSEAEVVLVPPRAVLKTTSGKLRRKATAAALASGALTVLARRRLAPAQAQASPGPVDLRATHPALRPRVAQAYVLAQVASLLGVAPSDLDADTPLRDLGLDSVQLVALADRLAEGLGVPVEVTLIFDHPTAAALGEALVQLGGGE